MYFFQIGAHQLIREMLPENIQINIVVAHHDQKSNGKKNKKRNLRKAVFDEVTDDK